MSIYFEFCWLYKKKTWEALKKFKKLVTFFGSFPEALKKRLGHLKTCPLVVECKADSWDAFACSFVCFRNFTEETIDRWHVKRLKRWLGTISLPVWTFQGKQSGSAASFNCTGAVRKAGFLSVKKWLLRKKHQVGALSLRGVRTFVTLSDLKKS